MRSSDADRQSERGPRLDMIPVISSVERLVLS